MERKYKIMEPAGGKRNWRQIQNGIKGIGYIVEKTVSTIILGLLAAAMAVFAGATTWIAFTEGSTTIGLFMGGVYCLLVAYWLVTRKNLGSPVYYDDDLHDPFVGTAMSENRDNIYHSHD